MKDALDKVCQREQELCEENDFLNRENAALLAKIAKIESNYDPDLVQKHAKMSLELQHAYMDNARLQRELRRQIGIKKDSSEVGTQTPTHDRAEIPTQTSSIIARQASTQTPQRELNHAHIQTETSVEIVGRQVSSEAKSEGERQHAHIQSRTPSIQRVVREASPERERQHALVRSRTPSIQRVVREASPEPSTEDDSSMFIYFFPLVIFFSYACVNFLTQILIFR